MNPKFFWLITAILLVSIHRAEAQQSAKIPRIGFISVSGNPKNPGVLIDSFRQGLRDLGYTEGKNILVEYRYTAVERSESLTLSPISYSSMLMFWSAPVLPPPVLLSKQQKRLLLLCWLPSILSKRERSVA